MVLKPSERTPIDVIVLAEAVDSAGTPAGMFNLVQGEGPVVGSALAAHPDVAMVSITGSTLAGAEVARAGAATIKRVAQELGGRSANILLPDCDLGLAVPTGVRTAFRNCGQSCSAPTRMLVPKQRYDEVKQLAAQAAAAIVVGDPADERTELGPLANERQFSKVQALIRADLEEGAELIAGGPGRPGGLEVGYYCRATIFGVPDLGRQLAQTEIFGPVLCILTYRDVDDAIRIANYSDHGLGGYVQGHDLATARAVAARMRTGTSIPTLRRPIRRRRSAGISTQATVAKGAASGSTTISRSSRSWATPKPGPAMNSEPARPGPLDGIVVLDLIHVVAGPYATFLETWAPR
jgi:aldehyde dehydrogenase (NAD+)